MFDVIIFGGGTAGCSCAWNCAKSGLKILLLEKENYLGGTMTGSLVVPVMKSGENLINSDFYNELIANMRINNEQVTFQGNPGWFNPIILKDVLYKMLIDNGATIELNCDILNNESLKIDINKSKILSIYNYKIHNDKFFNIEEILSGYIEAKYFVDTTGDLNFCQKINCNFLENFSDLPPMSLRFIMSGINLDEFAHQLLELDKDRDVSPVEYIGGQVHLSTAYTWDEGKNWALTPLFEDAVEKGILKDSDRNYFQIFTIPGMPDSLAFNCPRIIDKLDPLSYLDREKAYNIGLDAIKRISEFCKIYFCGFEKAYVSHIADKIGVRASRRIKGRYIYTIEDLRNGKKFENPALISNYPVDVHTKEKNTSILEQTGEYQLPIESLMSDDYDNLFVAGRGLSADELAQGALRVQASCFSMGEAVAKYIAKIIN